MDAIRFADSFEPTMTYEDEHLLILSKPSAYYVHPPENKYAKQKVGRNTCIHWLSDHHQLKSFPIHRLDYATEGLVLFGKTAVATTKLNEMMRAKEIKKYYDAIVRGWFKQPYGIIDLPLELDSTGDLVDCLTLYGTLYQMEFNESVNSKFSTSRYSWVDIELKTGRWHQIRRHMNRVAHPVIGDREHGDSHHNRFFRDHLKVDGLCLKAKRLVFTHPIENKVIDITSPMSPKWQRLTDLFCKSQAPDLT